MDKFNIANEQIMLLVVGALISLISSIIGFSIQEISKNVAKKAGKVSIYRKIVYQKNTEGNTWGFFSIDNDMIFSVPMWIEIHNSKDVVEVVRNFNLILYQNGYMVKRMTQINYSGEEPDRIYYGEAGAYSFMINPRNIKRYELLFYIKKSQVKTDFNEVRVQYYDTRNRIKEYRLIEKIECWNVSKKEPDDDWIQLI